MRILRRGRETLLTLLEAFVYDPLIDWTQSEEAAFPLAMRTTSEPGVRQTRKEMEWEVAEGMLVTKLAESESHWQKNRYRHDCVSVLVQLYCSDLSSFPFSSLFVHLPPSLPFSPSLPPTSFSPFFFSLPLCYCILNVVYFLFLFYTERIFAQFCLH